MDAEAKRLIAGYAWAVETVVEVAAEGTDDSTTELARHAYNAARHESQAGGSVKSCV